MTVSIAGFENYKRHLLTLLLLCVLALGVMAQQDTVKSYIFGHSLLDHRPPAIPTPSNETTVPHWLYLLAKHAGKYYGSSGQYGFLPQHANLPPISQWGYDSVPPVWESDLEPFSEADFTTAIVTAGNFVQWQGPDQEYPGDPGVTPINATEDIADWLVIQEEDIRIYIYENWPDMAPYLSGGFPPSASDLHNYYSYTEGAFHDWWLDYHDALLASRPEMEIRMIPVGPIMADLLSQSPLNAIPATDLYEDDAPHGRATLYFLASLITYMAIFEEPAPTDYPVPAIIHEDLADNYSATVDAIWTALSDFNDPDGNSRVFFNDITEVNNVRLDVDCLELYPNPTLGQMTIEGVLTPYSIQILDQNGSLYQTLDNTTDITLDLSTLPSGTYFLAITRTADNKVYLEKVIKQ